jgi:hypothetical protein
LLIPVAQAKTITANCQAFCGRLGIAYQLILRNTARTLLKAEEYGIKGAADAQLRPIEIGNGIFRG